MLFLIAGVAGEGKSLFGQIFAQKIGATYLDKDTLAAPFLTALMQEANDRHSEIYFNNFRPLEYRSLLQVAEENILLGQSVVLVAPFIKEVTNLEWIQLLEERFGRFHLFWIQADHQQLLANLRHRNLERDAEKIANPEAFLRSARLKPLYPYAEIQNSGTRTDLRLRAEEAAEKVLQEQGKP